LIIDSRPIEFDLVVTVVAELLTEDLRADAELVDGVRGVDCIFAKIERALARIAEIVVMAGVDDVALAGETAELDLVPGNGSRGHGCAARYEGEARHAPA